MSEIGDCFAGMKEASRVKRASNRETSAEILRKAGVSFVSYNDGAHLVITHRGANHNFWPGTGLWRTVSGIKGRGVGHLLKHLGVKYEF